jgi:CBS domain-containing protein
MFLLTIQVVNGIRRLIIIFFLLAQNIQSNNNHNIIEISTKSANLITASPGESVSGCMAKMLLKDIRHLPLLDETGKVVGIVSIKDLVKAELKEKEEAIRTLSNFALGKGGHFGSE